MSEHNKQRLRILAANERRDRLEPVADAVAALGHEVIAREVVVDDVGPVTSQTQPDVALVGHGNSVPHAPALIDRIVDEATCPVMLLLHTADPQFVAEASRHGVFAMLRARPPRQPQARRPRPSRRRRAPAAPGPRPGTGGGDEPAGEG